MVHGKSKDKLGLSNISGAKYKHPFHEATNQLTRRVAPLMKDPPPTCFNTLSEKKTSEPKNAPDGAHKYTNKYTHGHGNSITKSAQWGRFSENIHI